jgi:hypothetical protein
MWVERHLLFEKLSRPVIPYSAEHFYCVPECRLGNMNQMYGESTHGVRLGWPQFRELFRNEPFHCDSSILNGAWISGRTPQHCSTCTTDIARCTIWIQNLLETDQPSYPGVAFSLSYWLAPLIFGRTSYPILAESRKVTIRIELDHRFRRSRVRLIWFQIFDIGLRMTQLSWASRLHL